MSLLEDRVLGAMLGLAAGDALGTTLEFTRSGQFEPITDMIGGGPFRLKPGEWTDDTSMALCLAESLVECKRFDPVDQMQRYVRWYRNGYHSSNGTCFDIGNTVRAALHEFEQTGEPFCGSIDPAAAGNGSLMRLAPVALTYADELPQAIAWAAQSSRTTHGATEAVDACRYFAGLLIGALQGRQKEELLSPLFSPVGNLWNEDPLAPRIADIAMGSFQRKDADEIAASGYVVHTLEAALWAFARCSSFEEGALLAVNLGQDADTTGAVYGQLAGTYYGASAIPEGWRAKLVHTDTIIRLARGLMKKWVPPGLDSEDESDGNDSEGNM